MVAGVLVPRLLDLVGAAPPGSEHGLLELVRYFAYLQFTDWTRLAFVVVPCGILPVLALFQWPRQDPIARGLTLVAAGYFLFFFVLAHISLHYFVPVMVLPLVVAARVWSVDTVAGRAWQRTWQLAAVAAVLLSLPRSFALSDHHRQVGAAISETVVTTPARTRRSCTPAPCCTSCSPSTGSRACPTRASVAPRWSGCVMPTMAAPRLGGNYFLTRAGEPAPQGMRLLAADSGAALYLRSDSVWRMHQAMRPPTPPGSRVYDIPRGILFHRPYALSEGPRIIDVVATLKRAGIDVRPLLSRLGVQ